MGKKRTLDDFIRKAKEIHGDKYDYSKVNYIDSKTKICIICPEHGEFWQTPEKHLLGRGCRKCKLRTKPKMNLSNFIKKAIEIHGDKYDYSKVDYIDYITKICIICPIHGEFWQTPSSHLQGKGCPLCGGSKRHTTNDFIKKAIEVHGNKYDYSKVDYINMNTKVCINCPIHGEFWQAPSSHINGSGCPKCSSNTKKTLEDFIKKAKEIHGDKYDYSKVNYVNSKTKVCIICHKKNDFGVEHGEFFVTPEKHLLRKQGCPKCSGRYKTKEEFIFLAKKKHGNKYDYSKVEFNDMKTKVCIVCPEHGEFWQTPESHILGKGCCKCGYENTGEKLRLTKDEFIKKAKEIHGDKYDYSKVEYINAKTPVLLTCDLHGDFYISPDIHIYAKCGCPRCANSSSSYENEIISFIKDDLCINTETHNRKLISPKEIDIYLPDFKIGVEFNGLFWHSEYCLKDNKYHIDKLNSCKKSGINLIQIFEDEYINKKEIVKSKIKHILNKDINLPKIYARKCEALEISYNEASDFLENNHIQGKVPSTLYLGCFYCGKLIGVMTFKKQQKESKNWELTRFATDINYVCCGVGGKLFNYFVRKYNPIEVKSFADRRWTINENNNLYTKLGFNFDGYTSPDYRYFNPKYGTTRIHKFNLRRNNLIKNYGADPNDSESEMTKKIGFYKIWDCGLIRYVWKVQK